MHCSVEKKAGLRAYQSVESIILETLFPARYFFPFVKRLLSIRYIVPFVSTLPVHLILSFFRFNACILFMYFFLSFQAVHVIASFHSRQFLYSPFVDMFVLLQLVSFDCYFLPLVSPIPRWLLPSIRFNSFLPFAVKSFISIRPSLRFTSASPFVTSSLSLYLLQSVCYLNSFVATLPFHSLLPSFRFNSSVPFGSSFRFSSFLSFLTAFLSFQLFPFIRTAFLSFQLSPFIRYFLPFVSTLPFRPAVPSFQLFRFIRTASYCRPFVSTLSFHSLLPSVRFNSLLSFVPSFCSSTLTSCSLLLPFISSRSCGCVCPSVSPLW